MSLSYELVRSSRRRTVSIQIKSGQVRVLAPDFVSSQQIAQFVQQKSAWIERKISQFNVEQAKVIRPDFSEGASFYYMGQPLTLCLKSQRQADDALLMKVDQQNLYLFLPEAAYFKSPDLDLDKVLEATSEAVKPELVKPELVKQYLIHGYQMKAKQVLKCRFERLQDQLGLYATDFQVKYYKSRWGSCDSKQRIKLNWLLIMTPEFVIDYVIIHELCHLVHLNHSAEFWALVNRHTPNHIQAKNWLKEHQQALYWV